jgi:hypothetical protein
MAIVVVADMCRALSDPDSMASLADHLLNAHRSSWVNSARKLLLLLLLLLPAF